MATLVLSAVGGAIGGPVGAAVGAVIGQQVDRAVLKPKGRNGPRLTDLRVQAARYGAEIPAIYGTMRVGGTLIWSTDLIERRVKSGGSKSRPGTTTFSYSVSLALALSSRPIGGIGRIWADGNLLRGGAGDLKVRATLRVHHGDPDQALDPLIASAVGMPDASAFRGLAYLVLEELDLTDFGGRIPLLTVEVMADAAGDQWDRVTQGMGAPALTAAPARPPLLGYAASGDTGRDAVIPLATAWGLRMGGAGLAARLSDDMAVVNPSPMLGIADEAMDPRDIEWFRGDPTQRPQAVRVQHYDPDRDGQIGQQSALVPGTGRGERLIEAPVTMTAGAAQQLALSHAARASQGGDRIRMRTGLNGLHYAPGTVTALPDGSVWRVETLSIDGSGGRIDLTRARVNSIAPIAAADAGQPVAAPDVPVEDGAIAVLDLPAFDTATAQTPQVAIAGSGTVPGWRGADAWLVAATDRAPEPLGRVRQARLFGTLSEDMPMGDATLIDRRPSRLVTLMHAEQVPEPMPLTALSGTTNLVMIGDELIQFGSVEMGDGEGEWRIGQLLRGRYGTEPRHHPAGTRIIGIAHDDLLRVSPDLLAGIEASTARVEWMGHAGTTLNSLPMVPVGRSMRPLSPVHGSARRSGGGYRFEWRARSAVDWMWRDGVDVAFDEAGPAFRITFTGSLGGMVRESAVSHADLSAADLATLGNAIVADIVAIGRRGLSAPLRITASD